MLWMSSCMVWIFSQTYLSGIDVFLSRNSLSRPAEENRGLFVKNVNICWNKLKGPWYACTGIAAWLILLIFITECYCILSEYFTNVAYGLVKIVWRFIYRQAFKIMYFIPSKNMFQWCHRITWYSVMPTDGLIVSQKDLKFTVCIWHSIILSQLWCCEEDIQIKIFHQHWVVYFANWNGTNISS